MKYLIYALAAALACLTLTACDQTTDPVETPETEVTIQDRTDEQPQPVTTQPSAADEEPEADVSYEARFTGLKEEYREIEAEIGQMSSQARAELNQVWRDARAQRELVETRLQALENASEATREDLRDAIDDALANLEARLAEVRNELS